MTDREAAFRAGLEAAALWHEQAGAYSEKGSSPALSAHRFYAASLRAIPTPPGYAAPERKWVRAEDWRGKSQQRVPLWCCEHFMDVGDVVSAIWFETGEKGSLVGWGRLAGQLPAHVTPVLPGDLPEPPKERGK